jgi:hypothetical protein
MVLSEELSNAAELKGIIANEMEQGGFTDVINNESEVAGNRNGIRLSVLHLFIGGRSFFQQVMAAGDDADATLGLVNDMRSTIESLHFG